MAQAKCPGCGGVLHFVETVREYHTFEGWPDKSGHVELLELEDTQGVESVDPYIKCRGCGVKYNIKGEVIP